MYTLHILDDNEWLKLIDTEYNGNSLLFFIVHWCRSSYIFGV